MARVETAFVTCEDCDTEYEGFWPLEEDPDDEQDRAEAPVVTQVCPGCGHAQAVEFPGWSFRGEAG